MKNRPVVRLMAATALVLLVGAVGVSAEEAAATRLYLRNEGPACAGSPFLSVTAGTADVNCGYIHGAPLGEAYHHAGDATNKKIYATTPEEGTYSVDAARDVTGQVTIRNGRPDAAVPVRVGVGEVIVDLVLTGQNADGTEVALGTTSVKGTATPGTDTMVLPFTVDLDPALGQPTFSGLSLQTDVRGVHAYSGYTGANASSFFDVPVVPVTPAPAP